MDPGSTFLTLALLILIGMFVARPFFENKTAPDSASAEEKEHERSSLLAERDRLLNALQELDFDNALHKIPAEEYPLQRRQMVAKGVEILKKLDALQEKAASGSELDVEARLEEVIANRRAKRTLEAGPMNAVPQAAGSRGSQPSIVTAEDDEIERLISSRRQERKELSYGFCPKCGKPVQKSDQFCPRCGAKLS
ncbi:MAG TPA: zinc ribbon domain-containing protein [Anaerolineaceae bacterium]|nr:zinc ribbon domain-containing protein [Anaerolineaceae bacterium]